MVRFAIVFVVLLLTLFFLNLADPVQQAVILPFTSGIASVCSWVIQLFDANVTAVADQMINSQTGVGIHIVAGCNGVEALIIMFSAIMAFPAPWRYKVMGIVIGFFSIQFLNCIRIISLYYLVQWDKTWFEWFHLYIWQALLILEALVVWLIWLRYLPKQKATSVPDTAQA